MPGFDRTGPEGKGSKTGRGLGKCNTDDKDRVEDDDEDVFPVRLRKGRRFQNYLSNGRRGRRGRRFDIKNDD